MLALYRMGRQAEALAAYQDARRALVDELGIEPGAELSGLERALLTQDPAIDGSRLAAAGAAPQVERTCPRRARRRALDRRRARGDRCRAGGDPPRGRGRGRRRAADPGQPGGGDHRPGHQRGHRGALDRVPAGAARLRRRDGLAVGGEPG